MRLSVIYVLRAVEGVAQFKFIQHTVRDVEVLVVPGPRMDRGRPRADHRPVSRRRLGADVRVAIKVVDAIEAEGSGKYRYVVSHVPARTRAHPGNHDGMKLAMRDMNVPIR